MGASPRKTNLPGTPRRRREARREALHRRRGGCTTTRWAGRTTTTPRRGRPRGRRQRREKPRDAIRANAIFRHYTLDSRRSKTYPSAAQQISLRNLWCASSKCSPSSSCARGGGEGWSRSEKRTRAACKSGTKTTGRTRPRLWTSPEREKKTIKFSNSSSARRSVVSARSLGSRP